MKLLHLAHAITAVMMCVQCGRAADATPIDTSVGQAKAGLIDAIWQYHLTVIKAVVAAREQPDVTIDLAEFGRSVSVLESLTKISSNSGTRLGRLPTPELPGAIRLWEQWYVKNRGKLDVDTAGCSLRIEREARQLSKMQ